MARRSARCVACDLTHADHEVRCPQTGRPLEGAADLPPSLALALTRAAHRPRALLGRVVQGTYRPTSILAEGGTGAVYEAEHLPTGRPVALKVLHPAYARDPEAVRRFLFEARVAASIGHPNVCEVHDVGRLDDGGPYLVMERLLGQTLADRIERQGALPFVDALNVARQLLGALAAVHDKGVVHRDVKPENVFLVERVGLAPFVKLLDFGDASVDAAPRTHAVAGTPRYMAPEQARGEPSDHRADLYAAGVVLYESLTGRCPFVAFDYNGLVRLLASAEPCALRELRPSLPEPLEPFVRKALAKSPAARFQSAREFLAALAELRARALAGRPDPGELAPPAA